MPSKIKKKYRSYIHFRGNEYGEEEVRIEYHNGFFRNLFGFKTRVHVFVKNPQGRWCHKYIGNFAGKKDLEEIDQVLECMRQQKLYKDHLDVSVCLGVKMIYLTAPYSHPDPEIKQKRMEMFYRTDAKLSSEGNFTISPLLKVETTKHGKMPDSWEYWKDYSQNLLLKCDKMIVIKMDGWGYSEGVLAEIAFCKEIGIPIEYIEPA